MSKTEISNYDPTPIPCSEDERPSEDLQEIPCSNPLAGAELGDELGESVLDYLNLEKPEDARSGDPTNTKLISPSPNPAKMVHKQQLLHSCPKIEEEPVHDSDFDLNLNWAELSSSPTNPSLVPDSYDAPELSTPQFASIPIIIRSQTDKTNPRTTQWTASYRLPTLHLQSILLSARLPKL